jgi:DNA polymerase/3'-5' exonuclease PolX
MTPIRKYPIPYKAASAIADKVIAGIKPLCKRTAIAGSLRRYPASTVIRMGDIDLVAEPYSDVGWSKIVGRCHLRGIPVVDGPKMVRFSIRQGRNDVQVEIWRATDGKEELFPTPSNWGSILMARTGSLRFNQSIAQRAKDVGYAWVLSKGIVKGKDEEVLAGHTEASIFKTLEMPFIKPKDREEYYAD